MTDASVLGDSFTLDGLLALGADPHDLLERAGARCAARRSSLVQTDRFSAERGQYRFVQSVVRQVAYATQSRRDRKARHLAAADHLAGLPDPERRPRRRHRPAPPRRRRSGRSRRSRRRRPDGHGPAPTWSGPPSGHAGSGPPARPNACSRLAIGSHRGRRRSCAAAPVRGRRRATTRAPRRGPRPRGGRADALRPGARPDRRRGRRCPSAQPRPPSGTTRRPSPSPSHGWQALDGVAGAERARFELARALTAAHARPGGHGDPDAVRRRRCSSWPRRSTTPRPSPRRSAPSGRRIYRVGAHRGGVILLESAAVIAREHDLPLPLARALPNLAAFLNCRDLPAALRHAEQARDVARRAGLQALDGERRASTPPSGCGARAASTDVAELMPEGLESTDPQRDIAWRTFAGLARRGSRRALPARRVPDDDTDSRAQPRLVGHRRPDSCRRRRRPRRGHPSRTARPGPPARGLGLDDDFFLLWPPSRPGRAATQATSTSPSDSGRTGDRQPCPGSAHAAVTAQWHRLRGLLGGRPRRRPRARGDRAARRASTPWPAFGAVGSTPRPRRSSPAGWPPSTATTRPRRCSTPPARRTPTSAPPAGSPGSTPGTPASTGRPRPSERSGHSRSCHDPAGCGARRESVEEARRMRPA